MAEQTICLWLPHEWGRTLTPREQDHVTTADPDILLIPENHDTWTNHPKWKELATTLNTAIYAGFKTDDGRRLGLFYDPHTDIEHLYTKHSTADRLAFDTENWTPRTALEPLTYNNTTIGTTICHDHYFSPFMHSQSAAGASILLNLSARPVKRRKWGEVLQARAIENAAFTFCTMHGRNEDGSESPSNQAHAFAFGPTGDPLPVTDITTGTSMSLFDTAPNGLYTTTIDPERATAATESLTTQVLRSPITRVRDNEAGVSTRSETAVDVRVHDNSLHVSYADDDISVPIGNSSTFTIDDHDFYVISIPDTNVFDPSAFYRAVLDHPSPEDATLLFHNHWSTLTDTYHRSVVEPVLRARCVEWCSPALLTADEPPTMCGYQIANTAKDTHALPAQDGMCSFETQRAWGVTAAFKPVNHRREELEAVVQYADTVASH